MADDLAGMPVAPPAVTQLLTALNHDDDLVAVLRGHLYVEAILTEIIGTKYNGAVPVLHWLDLHRKLQIARAEDLIESLDRTALQALGGIRDSFAHLPVKGALTADDDAAIAKALPDLLNSRFYAFISPLMDKDRSRTGLIVRSGILYLYHTMLLRLARARNVGPRAKEDTT